jgi:hypothetical protein
MFHQIEAVISNLVWNGSHLFDRVRRTCAFHISNFYLVFDYLYDY